jgi:hypothetical protein
VLSGRGLCDGLVTRPEESYGVWCVFSVIEEPRRGGISQTGLSGHGREKKYQLLVLYAPLEGNLQFFYSEMNDNP